MSLATEQDLARQLRNVPNQVTALRLVLAIVLFVLLPFQYFTAATVLFTIAAGTDWVDGYYARKYGQVTMVGRIFDPFVDKIIICGSFIFLVSFANSGIQAWMAVVVVAREILVTALRNFLEGEGADFSAKMSGKLKMVLQCLAVILSLYGLSFGDDPRPAWLVWLLPLSVWGAVLLTIYSGLEYLLRAAKLMCRLAA